MEQKNPLETLISGVFAEMEKAKFSPETIQFYRKIFQRLIRMAAEMQKTILDPELSRKFISDSANSKTGKYCHSRYCCHSRCIKLLDSLNNSGKIDWSNTLKKGTDQPKTEAFLLVIDRFLQEIKNRGLKQNTIDSYRNVVCQFLQYCEDNGYDTLDEIQKKDILLFIQSLSKTWNSGSLRTAASALRCFVLVFQETEYLVASIPKNLQRNRDIIPVLTENEQHSLKLILQSDVVNKRDKAIGYLSLEIGLRAVDIANLKLSDIDWKCDTIHIMQQKTEQPLDIPLLPSFGNALFDYILNERPVSDSKFVFLRQNAPYLPMRTHASYHKIIWKIFQKAGIRTNGELCGTRLMRHNAASKMLESDIPLPVISSALGHVNPDSVTVYLTTDEERLVSCVLPLSVLMEKSGIEND